MKRPRNSWKIVTVILAAIIAASAGIYVGWHRIPVARQSPDTTVSQPATQLATQSAQLLITPDLGWAYQYNLEPITWTPGGIPPVAIPAGDGRNGVYGQYSSDLSALSFTEVAGIVITITNNNSYPVPVSSVTIAFFDSQGNEITTGQFMPLVAAIGPGNTVTINDQGFTSATRDLSTVETSDIPANAVSATATGYTQ